MALCELRYSSAALQKQTGAYVILPETGKAPYATLYLLHGLSDDYTIWQRRTSIERYVAERPLIVVMPDGGRGFYTDAHEGFAYEKALATELVDRIDRTFPTRREREGRCVAGLSMGGYGALKFALAHPDRFCAASSHSGALAFGHGPLSPRDGKPYSPEFQRILGPDPVGGPSDLFALAGKLEPEQRPAVRIDCGVDDQLIASNREFDAHLTRIGFAHEYAEFPGAHTWDYWDRHIQDTLAFFKDRMSL